MEFYKVLKLKLCIVHTYVQTSQQGLSKIGNLATATLSSRHGRNLILTSPMQAKWRNNFQGKNCGCQKKNKKKLEGAPLGGLGGSWRKTCGYIEILTAVSFFSPPSLLGKPPSQPGGLSPDTNLFEINTDIYLCIYR